MKVTATELPEVLLIEPEVFSDQRGFFFESWNERTFSAATGIDTDFVQDNHSRSSLGVLRGIHYQLRKAQGKLVRVVSGAVFDVAVDLRASSTNFGRWVGVELSARNHRQLWIPAGFGHAFLALTDGADFLYKTTEYRFEEGERCIIWNDGSINISWPTNSLPVISPKDQSGSVFLEAEVFD